MRASNRGKTGAIGETAVTLQFEQLGWGVAPNPTQHDLGTDLWLQARDDRGFDLGAVVGAQVKSGDSWFGSPSWDDSGQLVGWWFADTDGRHIKYWTSHRVPHLLVFHRPETGVSYWVHVTTDRTVSTGRGVKILVPQHNTIDSAHFEDLVRLAIGNQVGTQWEGSSWEGGKAILRADRLRHALLVPRLIAPHPNLTVTSLTAEQAIALLAKMRLRDLDPKSRRETKAPSPDEARASNDWVWQLYAATYDELIAGAGTDKIEALIHTTDLPFERAAAAAITCALLIETGERERGLSVVRRILDWDDCEPIDHGWLLMHEARCLAELGRLEEAHEKAVEVQGLRGTSVNDATVMAIVGSSSDLIFSVSGWGSGNLPAAVTGRDTLAAWWRTQEVAWGLQHHWNEAYKGWAHDARVAFGANDEMWLRLRAASLIAGMAADHSAWRHTAGMLAERMLVTANSDASHIGIAEALRLLRHVGDADSVKLAVRHLLRSGPLQPVVEDASSIDLASSTRTSIRADMEMIQRAADVLLTSDADRLTRSLLQILRDPAPFVERLQPNFRVGPIVLETLSELVPSASSNAVRAVVDHIVALPTQDDQTWAHYYAALIRSVPDESWTDHDRLSLAKRSDGDNFELVEATTSLIAAGDPDVRHAQRAKIANGDLAALASFGDVRDLDPDTVKALVADLSRQITAEIDDLRRGQHALGGPDATATLILINKWHPAEAHWDAVESMLSVETLFTDHLVEPLKRLHSPGTSIPAAASERMVPILRGIMTTAPDPHPFFQTPDVRGSAARALAALDPRAITDHELWDLLNGDEDRRIAAVYIVATRDDSRDLSTLAVLANDRSVRVRAVVAFNLARWIAHGVAEQPALALLTHVLNDPGTLVARAVSEQLAQSPPSDVSAPIVAILKDHPSAIVRRSLYEHNQSSPRKRDPADE